MEEALFYCRLFSLIEQALHLPHFSFKVAVIVENISAVFELEEIVFALKDRIVGLNTGRWNYIFSIVKRFQHQP